jgi:hypothetical protein
MTGSGVTRLFIVGEWRITRSLSSGAHSRDPLANPPLDLEVRGSMSLATRKLPAAVAAVVSIASAHAISTRTIAVSMDTGGGTDTTVRAANQGGVLNV